MGSFLGLDAFGTPYWFLVKNKKQMLDFSNIAKSSDADLKIVKGLEQEKLLLYFLTAAERKAPIEAWHSFAYSISHQLEDFFISIVRDNIPGFRPNNVTSFKSFQENAFYAK
jgi:hypothetical protein